MLLDESNEERLTLEGGIEETIDVQIEGDPGSGGNAFAKSTFYKLSELGHPFDARDFVIVDRKKGP